MNKNIKLSSNNQSNTQNFRKVILKLELYLPISSVDFDDDFDVADYINHKFETDVEFFGEVDSACITITDEYF